MIKIQLRADPDNPELLAPNERTNIQISFRFKIGDTDKELIKQISVQNLNHIASAIEAELLRIKFEKP